MLNRFQSMKQTLQSGYDSVKRNLTSTQAIEKDLDDALQKLRPKKDSNGAYMRENGRIVVDVDPENQEDKLNIDTFESIRRATILRNRVKEKISEGAENVPNALVGASVGAVSTSYFNGLSIGGILDGAVSGAFRATVFKQAVTQFGFWGKRCAVLGALTAAPSVIAGAEMGALLGALIESFEKHDAFGDWTKMGLKIGLISGMCTYGLGIEAILLAGYYLAGAGAVVDVVVNAREALRGPGALCLIG